MQYTDKEVDVLAEAGLPQVPAAVSVQKTVEVLQSQYLGPSGRRARGDEGTDFIDISGDKQRPIARWYRQNPSVYR